MCKINLLSEVIMHYSKILFSILFVLLISCTGKKTGRKIDNGKVEIEVEEITFPPQNVLQLKSYYLSSSIHKDSVDFLIGYNHKLHSLDYINLKSKLVTQTMLFSEGPNTLSRLSGIYGHTLDSIWVSDDSERAFLINRTGNVKNIVNLRESIIDDEQLLIITNYAMFTSHLYYNEVHQSLMFLVKNLSSNTFGIREVFVNEEREPITYQLSPSKIVPNLKGEYAFMDAPNVNIVGENIIYNYPVESSIYTLNMSTSEKNIIMADSRYTSNLVDKDAPGEDYSAIEKRRIENPHFYDVMYIPKFKMYARLHVGEVSFDQSRGMDNLINDRTLYLMLFNEKMERVCELELSRHRYNYFTGWSTSYGGIALFVDNVLDENNDTDDLIIDIVSPKSINSKE